MTIVYILIVQLLLLQEQQGVTDFVDKILEVWGEEVEPGEAPNAPHMTHMWEPLRVFPKPLLVHALSETAALIFRVVLRAHRFHHLRHKVRWPSGLHLLGRY